MANYDDLEKKVLGGLMQCSLLEGCWDCPYRVEPENSTERAMCLPALHKDAHLIILHLDSIVSQMGRGGVVLDGGEAP